MGDLWRHRDFLRLWGAQTISTVGTQITLIALPLTAIIVLDASTFAVAALTAMDTLPFLLLALPAGIWIDRMRRRPLMVVAEVGRAGALLSIPVAYLLDVLTLGQLFVAGFAAGALAVVFDLAYLSYLPGLVGRERLTGGNARMEATRAGAQAAGPGLGGVLVGLFGAPIAILADAVSYVLSAFLIGSIRHTEPEPTAERRSALAELREGIGYVFRQPYLRALTLTIGASNLFTFMVIALFMVYAVRRLGLSPELIGLVFTIASLAGLVGAVVNGRIIRRVGIGPTIVATSMLASLSWLSVPLAPPSNPLPLVIAGAVLGPFFGVMFNLNQLSLRQAITPERLMGRMNSVVRFMYWGTMPIGSLAGGAVATLIGIRPTLFLGVVGGTLAFAPLAVTSLARLHAIPTEPEEVPPLTPLVPAPLVPDA
ncbi:MAG: MFS transporter [Thermoleophilia bacterium]|nr:MFS transporter [Thermoleophilia bacterium]